MTAANHIPRGRTFATARVADDRQVSMWERHNADALIALACRPAEAVFEGLQRNVELGRIRLAMVCGNRHTVERSGALIESHPAGAVAVYGALRGEAMLDYGGRRRVLRPGDVFVCDVDEPFVRTFGHGLWELVVTVPKEDFGALTRMTSLREPIVVTAESDPRVRALLQQVGRATRAVEPVPADADAVLELVSVIASPGRVSLPVAHRTAARVFIEDRLADPSLSASVVAEGIGVSERSLSRVFAGGGLTVPRYILGRRLDAAYSVLAGGIDRHRRIADVAVQWGFTSASHFSRTFLDRFGASPSEVCRQAAADFPESAILSPDARTVAS